MTESLQRSPAGQASGRSARAERGLVLVLRFFGCVDLLALAAVVMPRAWMARGHAWAGLGEVPAAPLVGYLARSASLLYALHGATVLFISFDLPRYSRLVTFLAAAALVHGALMLGIDLAEGMPPWWTILEGPAFAATGAVVLVLQRLAGR
jgi:hypothetical protein